MKQIKKSRSQLLKYEKVEYYKPNIHHPNNWKYDRYAPNFEREKEPYQNTVIKRLHANKKPITTTTVTSSQAGMQHKGVPDRTIYTQHGWKTIKTVGSTHEINKLPFNRNPSLLKSATMRPNYKLSTTPFVDRDELASLHQITVTQKLN